jgi:hypothetical protein
LLAGYVEMNKAALAKSDEALKLPRSRYPVDCSLCSQTPLPHLAWLKHLAELDQYKVELSLIRGDSHEAAEAITSILCLARTIENEPTLISQVVRMKFLTMGVASFERTLNLSYSAADSSNLSSFFAQTAQAQCLARALIGERAMMAPYFRTSRQENPRIYPPKKPAGEDAVGNIRGRDWVLLKLIGYYEMDFGQFLFVMSNVIPLASLPPPANLEVDRHFAKAAAFSKKKKRAISALVFSSYQGTAARETENLARLRLAVTALAIEQFRNQNGKLPGALQGLKPAIISEIPQDPFTSSELLYRQLPKGYIVYSVGPDLVDDGGKEEPASSKARNDTYDITFTVER